MKKSRVLLTALLAVVLATATFTTTVRIGDYLDARQHTDKTLVNIAEQNHRNGLILIDCTQPGEHPRSDPDPDCYKRGQSGQADALVAVNLGVGCVIQVIDGRYPDVCEPIAVVLREKHIVG